MINFTHNFTQSTLDLSNITITKDSLSILVNLSSQLQNNKTLYIEDNNFASLCVKDEEIGSIEEISTLCTGTNETDFTACLGSNTMINGLNCTDTGAIIKVENLKYSAIRGTQSTSSSPSPSGGSSSSSSKSKKIIETLQCTTDSQCSKDKTCFNNQCVKLFDIKLIDIDSPVGSDGFLGFTYFIKGVADINGDVIIDFWLEKEGEVISSGTDTIYLGSFEEKTETTKIFIPKELSKGSYDFYTKVSFENYDAISHRTIYVEQKEELEVRLETPLDIRRYNTIYNLLLIAYLIIILKLLSMYFNYKNRKLELEIKNKSEVKEKTIKDIMIKPEIEEKTIKKIPIKSKITENLIVKKRTKNNLTKELLKKVLSKKKKPNYNLQKNSKK